MECGESDGMDAWWRLGEAQRAAGDACGALAHYQQLAAILGAAHPTYPDAVLATVELHRELGEEVEAQRSVVACVRACCSCSRIAPRCHPASVMHQLEQLLQATLDELPDDPLAAEAFVVQRAAILHSCEKHVRGQRMAAP